MLPRILEPELMDTADDAREYDAMDHADVNKLFVTDLLAALSDWSLASTKLSPGNRPVQSAASALEILDLGAGTAQIPVELARRAPQFQITVLDAAKSMLALARQNIVTAGLNSRLTLLLGDAKKLHIADGTFHAVISNSILHHIPEPSDVISESVRVVTPGGLLFHRDLCRPRNKSELGRIVNTYAVAANAYQRRLFADSLHAALTVEEMQRLVSDLGFARETVRKTSDRHWTWIATNI
jgi:ubiquinone/menaquinone biosynthesis C-methylase UbiE